MRPRPRDKPNEPSDSRERNTLIAHAARAPSLASALFKNAESSVYAILDGAAIASLLDMLERESPEHACLYRLETGSELAAVSPYLIALEPAAAFTRWVLDNCAGQHWGVFLVSPNDLNALRLRMRKLTLVNDDLDRTRLFRFYDPRVLNEYLLMFDAAQLTQFFDGVESYFAEADASGKRWTRYTFNGAELAAQSIELART